MFVYVVACWLTSICLWQTVWSKCFCNYGNVTPCHLNVQLPTQHFAVQSFHFLFDNIIPGSWQCVCEVLWQQCTTTEVHNGTKSHKVVATHNQEDTQTRLPKPQRREHNSRENKRTQLCFFFCFILGELPQLFSQPAELRAACTGLSPQPRLQQHTPHPPDWPCHTTAHKNPPQTGHKRVRPTHGHTYPNTRLPTINHYSGGLGGCF